MTTDPKNLVGVTLSGRYRVERRIGEGGMGAIFEATQLSLGRRVAIKVVKPARGGDDDTAANEAVARFERETRAIASLQHTNIVAVVDAGKADDGTMYLAMELLDGENVRQILKRERVLDVQRALAIAGDVASALVAAHGAGIIHRDLKAENVMLVKLAGKQELAKVLDFGVAKLTTQTEAPPVTGSGFVAGTPGTIAPEQMVGKHDDPRSDLYSLGVLLFEMLSGTGPFSAPSTMELMLKHLSEPAPRLADFARTRGAPEVPAAVDALVASLLAKDPEERPPSAAALVDALAGLADASRATVADVRVPTPASGMQPVGSRVVAVPTPMPSSTPAAPSRGPSTSPWSPALTPGSAPVVTPDVTPGGTPTGPTSAHGGTSPTTAVPVPPSPRPPRVKMAVRALATLAAGAVLMGAFIEWQRHRAERSSQIPEARADIDRAIDDFWNADLDRLDDDATGAIALDPDAALAYVLRAAGKGVARRPTVRFDADIALARDAVDKHATMMLNRTRTESLIDVLKQVGFEDVMHAFDAHCATYSGCTDLERVLAAEKLFLSLAPADDIEHVLAGLSDHNTAPMALLARARTLRWQSRLPESRALLEQALTEAPGRPALVEALVDTLLEEGERDAAVAALAKLAARDDRAAIRLAAWRTRAGDPNAFDAVVARVRGLPGHSDERIDMLTHAGDTLASLGRFAEAEKLWNEAIDDRPPTPVGDARALETAGVAVLMGVVRPDRAFAERWLDKMNGIGLATAPGSSRVAAFQIAARALLAAIFGGDVERAKADLARLEQTKNDTPVVVVSARYHIAMREGRYDDAEQIANTSMDRCFRPAHLAQVALAKNDAATAARLAEEATSVESQRACTTGDDLVPFVQSVMFARWLADRGYAAMERNDVDEAHALFTRFVAFWPNADPLVEPPGTTPPHSTAAMSAVGFWLSSQAR